MLKLRGRTSAVCLVISILCIVALFFMWQAAKRRDAQAAEKAELEAWFEENYHKLDDKEYGGMRVLESNGLEIWVPKQPIEEE